jgi:hypothetical protein
MRFAGDALMEEKERRQQKKRSQTGLTAPAKRQRSDG